MIIENKEIIIKLKASGCLTFLVGSEFFKYNTSNIKVYSNVEDLTKDVELKFIKNSQILIKGSRGIQLEKIEAPEIKK